MANNGKWLRTGLFWLLITLVVVVIAVFIFHSPSDTQSVNVSTILNDIKADIAKNQQDTLSVATGTITLTRGKAPNASRESATINDSFDITKVLKDKDRKSVV